MHSCNDCPKRPTCTAICPKVEKLLPPQNGRPRAELNRQDRSIAWAIQDVEALLPRRQREIARLYHRYGWREDRIAERLGITQQAVSISLENLRKRLPKLLVKTANYGGG